MRAALRVCSYYCAACGIKMEGEEARLGRTSLEDPTVYCPACVADHEIEVIPAERRPDRAPGVWRASDAGAATDLSRGRRRVARRRPPGAAEGRRGPARGEGGSGPPLPAIGLAVAAVAALVLGAILLLGPAEPDGGEAAVAAQDAEAPRADPAVKPEAAGDVAATGRERSAPSAAPPPADEAVRPPEQVAPEQQGEAQEVVGNARSLRLHLRGCQWEARMAEQNRVYFDSVADAEREGYEPCQACLR